MKTLDELIADAGHVADLPDGVLERCEAELARKVTALRLDPSTTHPVGPSRRASHRTIALRWVAIPAAAAAVTVTLVVWPGGAGVDSSAASMFTTWQGVPAPLDASELAEVATACKNQDAARKVFLNAPDITSLTTATVDATERRGPWALVALSTVDGETAMCLTHRDDAGTVNVEYLGTAQSHPGDALETTGLADLSGYGDLGVLDTVAQEGLSVPPSAYLPADSVRLTNAWAASFRNAGAFAMVDGVAGSEVSRVTIHKGGHVVEATVANGRFVAWWPEPTMPIVYATASAQIEPSEAACSNGTCAVQGWNERVTATITLVDGAVVDGVPLGPIASGGVPFNSFVGQHR